jgi:hypothetical protein
MFIARRAQKDCLYFVWTRSRLTIHTLFQSVQILTSSTFEEFAKQAEILATQPATIESKQGISCNCPSHFRYFSKLYAQEAAEAEAEAERRERLAQEYSVKKKATENK